MSLDYTSGCVNFRDVGVFINWIVGEQCLPENKIYRGGSIDYVKDFAEIEHPQSIFNLRNGHDSIGDEIDYYHFPMSNKIEKYETSQKEVRKWLNEILQTFEDPELQYPILIHCLSGKDRTGIVVAAILKVLGIPNETIIEEYLLSEGEVKTEWINQALEGIGAPKDYFKSLDLDLIKKNILEK